jgi:hypothetical protein
MMRCYEIEKCIVSFLGYNLFFEVMHTITDKEILGKGTVKPFLAITSIESLVEAIGKPLLL